MKHIRWDYMRIQDPWHHTGEEEPVFLIRAQDSVSGDAVRAWAKLAEAAGADPRICDLAREQAAAMDAWTPKKVADAPPPTKSSWLKRVLCFIGFHGAGNVERESMYHAYHFRCKVCHRAWFEYD